MSASDESIDRTPVADILVADDNAVNLRLLIDMLGELDYEVRAATSGRRALAIATASPPDLVLLDVTMPDMDGYAVCRELKANPATRDIPVIFISGLDNPADRSTAFRAGGADFILKPFECDEVLARIETHLTIARLRREVAELREALARATGSA